MVKAHLGVATDELCGFVRMEDEYGNPQYEKFINAVMDCKLHIKDKNTNDCLDIQQDVEQPYSIWTQFADLVFGSAHNRKADRYIPIAEIRQALQNGMGDKCDVNPYIDQYLEREAAAPKIDVFKENITQAELAGMADADAAEVFAQFINQKADELQEQQEQYDNVDYEDLIDYKKDSTITEHLKKAVGKSFQFYHKVTEEEYYKKLMEKSYEERCAFLMEQNQWILVRVKADDRGLSRFIMALVLNDVLYEAAEQWSREYENEGT